MAVSMDKVVLHQHGKEGFCADVGDYFVHVVLVALVEADCFAFNKLLNEDFVGGDRMYFRETYVFFVDYSVELVEVALLLQEEDLL